jgi:hypothetical protein
MLEAKDMTPAGGGQGTRIVMVPGPAGSGVTPLAYADRKASVRDHASGACRAGHRTVLPPIAATKSRRERRPTL